MAITYDVPNNRITVTGYSAGTPCNFTDLYNADKAGTLSLHARTGIAGTDGAVVATDRAERPADYVVLGGASNDLYITVANWNGTTATIRITGTDRSGVAQTEDIVINANGQYNTTKWFKTITHTQVTSATVTSFDYDLTQGQWGVVWKQGGTQFLFDSRIYLGDGSTATYFADTNKQIVFSDITVTGEKIIQVTTNANFTLGQVDDISDKITKNGCEVIFENQTGIYNYGIFNEGTVNLYSSTIKGMDGTFYLYYLNRVWNSQTYGATIYQGDVDIYSLRAFQSPFGIYGPTGEMNEIAIKKCNIAIRFGTSCTVKNAICSENNYLASPWSNDKTVNLIDCVTDNWLFLWSDKTGNTIYRQNTFNLKVTDKDGNNINGASVKIWDKDDTLIVDTTTAAGVIAEQTITRGYYNQANGNTLQDKSPHKIEIKKAGYQTYTKKFTLYKKIDWTIRLIHTAVNPDQETF